MADRDASPLVEGVQDLAGGIGIAWQTRELSPAAVFTLLAQQERDRLVYRLLTGFCPAET